MAERPKDEPLMDSAFSFWLKGGIMLVRIMYQNGKYDMVKPIIINELISSSKLEKFFRSGGWVTVGIDPIRGIGGSYEGPERRRASEYVI